jgi:hypothetical protein
MGPGDLLSKRGAVSHLFRGTGRNRNGPRLAGMGDATKRKFTQWNYGMSKTILLHVFDWRRRIWQMGLFYFGGHAVVPAKSSS